MPGVLTCGASTSRSSSTVCAPTDALAEAFALADRVGVLERGKLVQLGRPEEIYTSPVTAFVARFTGLAGELPVRIGSRQPDGTIEVEPTSLPLARPLHARSALNGSAAVGNNALLTIRPTAVRISLPHENTHHLIGTVADVAFRDRGYEHAVDIPGQTRISGVFAETRTNRGETVGLRFDSSGCLAFAAEG